MNISGVLIHTPANKSAAVSKMLCKLKGVEVHANDKGKLVVTIEDENTHALADRVMQFQNMPNILSVAVVYHHDEDNCDDPIDPATLPACGCNELNSQEATI